MCLQVKNQNQSDETVINGEIVKTPDKNETAPGYQYYRRAFMKPLIGQNVYKPDILATSTQLTRRACIKLQTIVNEGQKSTCYKILTRTTQPAHVIAVAVVLFIICLLWPEHHHEATHDLLQDNVVGIKKASGFTKLLYLGSFAAHFGAQLWMTFVSGLALYFSLPRHTFGMCQEVLFPKYFTLNTILSSFTLFGFVNMNKQNTGSAMIQTIDLCICLLLELIVRLYFTPPLLKLMRQKYKMEQKIGTGSEIGQEVQGDLINCPHYQKIHKQFRRIHMMTAIANICTMVCSFVHLNYLASKITFL